MTGPRIEGASMGRACSTLIFAALRDGGADIRCLWQPDQFPLCQHHYPHCIPNDVPLVIFVYGDPVDIMLSLQSARTTYGEPWMRSHFFHMAADYAEWPAWKERDVLNLRRMFEAYMRPQRYAMLALRGPAIWRLRSVVEDICGVPLRLPPEDKDRLGRRRREADPAVVEALRHTHQELCQAVAEAPDVCFWEARTQPLEQ